ncbi:putative serine palmitoyltransferase 2 [Aspergillus ochraceoroseus]|uniref:Putative serine palmitoyltransferase 2 n=1 Tax=Aspergillus ochraceoroseus TaxID=138278 RepID=A0A0F8V0L3_9EURO|nr:putative serine palmitoyltransferase 2 [Aspergillus ochraceoroseus]
MPRRSASTSSANDPSNTSSYSSTSGKGGVAIKASSKPNRLSQLFSTSPKSKAEPQTALAALQIASGTPHPSTTAPPISSASLSLPTISLSTATADNPNMNEPPTTLFQPLSPEEARRLAKQHAQFGPIGHPSHRYSSRHPGGPFPEPIMDEPPYYYLLTTYISYLILIAFGHVRDFFGKRFREENYRHLKPRNGYGALNSDFDNFYVRRLKLRINDCFERPVTGVPGRYITLVNRATDDHNKSFYLTGTTTDTLNLSSYNYLGFAQSEGPCADIAEESIRKYGITPVSSRAEVGTQDLHVEVEELVANFVGKEASMVFSMGFGTNANIFPALVGKGCLIISDELNHASIRFGARLSGASITMFKHNDMRELELKLREAISQGQPRTHRPWKKILVVVEGLYSMEGSMCNLPGIIALKRRYKFHLFIDEAHSIGAIGPRGRGVCDYFGIDTDEVDILMDKVMIDKLRATNSGVVYGESPSPVVLAQIMSALRLISGGIIPGQGEERLQRLAFNSRYLRLGLKRLGFIVYGHDDSPIIPILLFNPAKMPAFSHEMLKRKISVVVVGYPATPLVSSRARFCVSAAHTKEDLDRILAACDEIGNILQLKFSTGVAGGAVPTSDDMAPPPEKEAEWRQKRNPRIVPPRWRIEDVIRRGVQDVKSPLY